MKAGRRLAPGILVLIAGCATLGDGPDVAVRTPTAVDGDPVALAWPFQVAPDPGLHGFRLRLETGGTIVAVRPDSANPEPSAAGWVGSHRSGEAIWSGPSPTRPVPLTILVRATAPGDQELRVRYASEPTGDASGWTCERWIYRVPEGRIERDGC